MRNSKTTLSYTISDTIAGAILTTCGFFIFVPCILSNELESWLLVLIGSGCLWSVVETLRCLIIDFTVTFDEEGFVVKKHNRMINKETTDGYKWKEISGLSFTGLYSRSASPRLVVFYKGGGCDKIGFRYTIKHREFTKLAQKYSGRSNIVFPARKRKLYEKEW
jgi:hypothetical protein